MLAAIYEHMSERDQAAEMYARIVEIDPDDTEAWEHLGTWRSLQGNAEAAVEAYSRALGTDPQRYTASFSLAETYLELERYQEELTVYQGLVAAALQRLAD